MSQRNIKRNSKAEDSNSYRGDRAQVAVRIRPLNRFDNGCECVLDSTGNTITVKAKGIPQDNKTYTYDHVFTEGQDHVYEAIGKPMLHDAFEGYNVCLFSYGQTGSGKTFSILGESDKEGIIPRITKAMFQLVQERLENDQTLTIKITMAYIEIYNEKVRDLLEQRKKGQLELTPLEIRETPDKKVYVDGLWRPTVTNCDRIFKLIDFGNSQKQISETKMNEKSSRSHSILQFTVSQIHDPPGAFPEQRDIESVLTIVDLAGSERQSKSEAEGKQFEEMKKINHSLLMLGRALNSFSDQKGHVPLRDSRITRLLSDCFGGNSRLWMLACVSPSAYNTTETISTLEYAQNAKSITNSAHVNSIQQRLELQELRESHDRLLRVTDDQNERLKRLEAELRELKEENSALRNYRAEADRLKRRVSEMEIKELKLNSAREQQPESSRTARGSQLASGSSSLYIGRAKVSLRNIIDQSNHYGTLPLLSDNPEAQGAALVVNIYPVDAKGSCKLLENEKRSPQDLIGQRVDFVVHVIKATGIPERYTHSVHCKYVYKWAEKDSYRTPDVKGVLVQEFDFKKRFAFTKMNQGLIDYFMSDSVITFEVFGLSA